MKKSAIVRVSQSLRYHSTFHCSLETRTNFIKQQQWQLLCLRFYFNIFHLDQKTASEVHVNYKNGGNIEVTSASALYSIQIHAKLALETEKYVHSTCTIWTTCPHSSGSEMSSAALTAILTAARKRGITTILQQTDEKMTKQHVKLTKL